jgi:hypothetical protein
VNGRLLLEGVPPHHDKQGDLIGTDDKQQIYPQYILQEGHLGMGRITESGHIGGPDLQDKQRAPIPHLSAEIFDLLQGFGGDPVPLI